MILVAEGIMLAGAAFGVIVFIYANVFIVRRLYGHDRRLSRTEAMACQAAAATTLPSTEVISTEPSLAVSQEAMFYLYHEQVRRFIDAKIDIMRSTAETQNRIMLMQAQAVCTGAVPAPALMIEAGEARDTRMAMVPACVEETAPRSGLIAAIAEQHRMLRTEAKRHLDEIDHQIRSLPGPSPEVWMMAQVHEHAVG